MKLLQSLFGRRPKTGADASGETAARRSTGSASREPPPPPPRCAPSSAGPGGGPRAPEGAAPRPLCSLSDVAVISAVLAPERGGEFDRIARDAGGAFREAHGSREERLFALASLRTRGALTRRSLVRAEDIPSWARGRMPASAAPVSDVASTLPAHVTRAVDAALGCWEESRGPGFGEWWPPGAGLVEHER